MGVGVLPPKAADRSSLSHTSAFSVQIINMGAAGGQL